MLTVNYVLGYESPGFFFENADVNQDNGVNVTDIMKIVSIVLGN